MEELSFEVVSTTLGEAIRFHQQPGRCSPADGGRCRPAHGLGWHRRRLLANQCGPNGVPGHSRRNCADEVKNRCDRNRRPKPRTLLIHCSAGPRSPTSPSRRIHIRRRIETDPQRHRGRPHEFSGHNRCQPQVEISALAVPTWGNTRLRVALALDNKGSMASEGKMDALKTASHNLLTQLKNAAVHPEGVYVSIVPFSKDVNFGPDNYAESWVRWDLWEAVNGPAAARNITSKAAASRIARSGRRPPIAPGMAASSTAPRTMHLCQTPRCIRPNSTLRARPP